VKAPQKQLPFEALLLSGHSKKDLSRF